MYRMRLERGLERATRHIERLRDQTTGAELGRVREALYVIQDIEQLKRECRLAKQQQSAAEHAAEENTSTGVTSGAVNCSSGKAMDSDDVSGPNKATEAAGEEVAEVYPVVPTD